MSAPVLKTVLNLDSPEAQARAAHWADRSHLSAARLAVCELTAQGTHPLVRSQ